MNSPYKYIALFLIIVLIVIVGIYYWIAPSRLAQVNTPLPVSSASTTTSVACQSTNLTATLTNGSGTAGTYFYTLSLNNNGTSACNYNGPTTVSLLDGNNTVLGTVSPPAANFTLLPAQTITSSIGFPDSANFTGANVCKTGVTTLAIYPPNQTTAVTVTNINQLRPGFTDSYCPGFQVQAFKK